MWAMISAVGSFFLGAGVTISHSVHSLGELARRARRPPRAARRPRPRPPSSRPPPSSRRAPRARRPRSAAARLGRAGYRAASRASRASGRAPRARGSRAADRRGAPRGSATRSPFSPPFSPSPHPSLSRARFLEGAELRREAARGARCASTSRAAPTDQRPVFLEDAAAVGVALATLGPPRRRRAALRLRERARDRPAARRRPRSSPEEPPVAGRGRLATAAAVAAMQASACVLGVHDVKAVWVGPGVARLKAEIHFDAHALARVRPPARRERGNTARTARARADKRAPLLLLTSSQATSTPARTRHVRADMRAAEDRPPRRRRRKVRPHCARRGRRSAAGCARASSAHRLDDVTTALKDGGNRHRLYAMGMWAPAFYSRRAACTTGHPA